MTFLSTDMAGSTRRCEEDPDAMRLAGARHEDVVRAASLRRELDGEFDTLDSKGQALDEAAMITWAFSQLDAIVESSGERSGA
jgi:hypothetical protein